MLVLTAFWAERRVWAGQVQAHRFFAPSSLRMTFCKYENATRHVEFADSSLQVFLRLLRDSSIENDIDKRDITVALDSFALEASMMLDARNNWQKLCREAVAEKDPDKLLRIATKINREFDHQQKKQVAAFFENMDKKTA